MHVERNPFTQEDSHYVIVTFKNDRVPTAQEKQGKWPKEFSVRENTGYIVFENFAKTQ